MANLTMTKVTVIAGTDVEQAVEEAIELAGRLSANVELDFNGIEIFIRPTSTVERTVEGYHTALRRGDKSVIV